MSQSKNTRPNQPDNLNLEPLAELLTQWINPEKLAAIVDEILFDYIKAVISGSSEIIPSEIENNNIYWVHELRNAIWQTTHPEND